MSSTMPHGIPRVKIATKLNASNMCNMQFQALNYTLVMIFLLDYSHNGLTALTT
jgi:hypothetical protein